MMNHDEIEKCPSRTKCSSHLRRYENQDNPHHWPTKIFTWTTEPLQIDKLQILFQKSLKKCLIG